MPCLAWAQRGGHGTPMAGIGQAWSTGRENMEMHYFSVTEDAVMETFHSSPWDLSITVTADIWGAFIMGQALHIFYIRRVLYGLIYMLHVLIRAQNRYYYYPHSTDGENEPQRG